MDSRHSIAIWDWEQLIDPISAYVHESKKDFSLFLKLPRGFGKNDVKMQVFEDVLTITGTKGSTEADAPFSSFTRSIKLPRSVAHDDVIAAWQADNELQVALPKRFGREPVAFEIPLDSDKDASLRDRIERKLAQPHSTSPEDHLAETEQRLKMAEERRKSLIEEETERLRQHSDHVKAVKERKHQMELAQHQFGHQGGQYPQMQQLPQQFPQQFPQQQQFPQAASQQFYPSGGQHHEPQSQFVGGPTTSQYPNIPPVQPGFAQPGLAQPHLGTGMHHHGGQPLQQGHLGGLAHQHPQSQYVGPTSGTGVHHGHMGTPQQMGGLGQHSSLEPQSQFVGGPPSSQYPDIPAGQQGATHQLGNQQGMRSPIF